MPDLINEQKIHDEITDPAITRLNTETIPAAEQAVQAVLTPVVEKLQGIINDGITAFGGEISKAVADIQAVVESLDGWNLSIGPITIPAIEIRLSKPKGTA